MINYDFSENLPAAVAKLKNDCDWVGLRGYSEKSQYIAVKNEKFDFHKERLDKGLMVEVLYDGHFGYAGTADLSFAGIQRAFLVAKTQAARFANLALTKFSANEVRPKVTGAYSSPKQESFDSLGLAEAVSRLIKISDSMNVGSEILVRSAKLMWLDTDITLVSSSGTEVHQDFSMMMTDFNATAKRGSEVQVRSDKGGLARCYQTGIEDFDLNIILPRTEIIGKEAVELLGAENCPSGKFDVILAPDQMMLQIHESIGHPLELDRILGDERNYAGWSFVTLEDIGKLQYGSPLMNVVYDPTQAKQLASFGFDDGGDPATLEYLIKEGKLVRGLGGRESQSRSGRPGVANFRSSGWNRVPIDRMGNINLVPGGKSLQDMISNMEKGIIMHSNKSWSIDDYRRKFQFSCEYAQMVEQGKITKTLKNPNYRGETLSFWGSLAGVGNESETFGTPFCGKGEPGQGIRVGHASPYCQFSKLQVFGGDV